MDILPAYRDMAELCGQNRRKDAMVLAGGQYKSRDTGSFRSMRRIISAENKTIKLAKQLKSKHGRDKAGCYLVEGPNLLAEAVEHNADILFAFFCEGADGVEGLAARAEAAGVDTVLIGSRLFAELSDTETPQPMLAVVKKPPPLRICAAGPGLAPAHGVPSAGVADGSAATGAGPGEGSEAGPGSWLILDRIQDPGNVGTLIRTADAAGFSAVISVKGTADVFSPKAARASAGALFRIALGFAEDAEGAMEAARACGKRVIAADAHGSASCYEADLSGGFALVAGNEGNGISSSFAEGADLIVRVPMAGGAESLNASIAAAVIMFEAMRQSRAADPQQGGHGFGQRTV